MIKPVLCPQANLDQPKYDRRGNGHFEMIGCADQGQGREIVRE